MDQMIDQSTIEGNFDRKSGRAAAPPNLPGERGWSAIETLGHLLRTLELRR